MVYLADERLSHRLAIASETIVLNFDRDWAAMPARMPALPDRAEAGARLP
jgi:hypothetical protein